jgi:hypothetical protein
VCWRFSGDRLDEMVPFEPSSKWRIGGSGDWNFQWKEFSDLGFLRDLNGPSPPIITAPISHEFPDGT